MSKLSMRKSGLFAFNPKRNKILFEDRIKRTEKDCLVEEDEDESQDLGECEIKQEENAVDGTAFMAKTNDLDGRMTRFVLDDEQPSTSKMAMGMLSGVTGVEQGEGDLPTTSMFKTCSLRRIPSGGIFHQFHQVPQGSNNSLDNEYTPEWSSESRKRPTFFISSGESDSEYEGSSMRSLKSAKTFTSDETLVDTVFVESNDQVLFAARYSQGRLAEVLPVQVVPLDDQTSPTLEMDESQDSSATETSSQSDENRDDEDDEGQGRGRKSGLHFLKRLRKGIATALVFFSD